MEKIKLYVCPVCNYMYKDYATCSDCCSTDIETELGYACDECECGYSDKESAEACCKKEVKKND